MKERQEFGGIKKVLSASKSYSRNNVFRNTINRRRDNIKVVHKSEAVDKRKAELEKLRRRSLTKDIANRLQNAEAPAEMNLINFTERRRKSLQLEKAKLREAKTYMNNYRADGNEVDNFTKHRRESLELEKVKLQEAKMYMNNYRTDGNEVNTFTESRRKSLQFEKAKQQEAKTYLNNYRGEYNGLLTSSHHRRFSTGSKSSRMPSNAKINTVSMSPKQLFIQNECHKTKYKGRSLGPCDVRKPRETPNKRARMSAPKAKKDLRKHKTGDSRRLRFDDSANVFLTKEIDHNGPPLSERIPGFRNGTHNNDLGIASVGRKYLTGGDNNESQNSFSDSSSIPQEGIRSKVARNEECTISDRLGKNDCKNIDSNRHFVATLLGLQSSAHFFDRYDSDISITANSNSDIDGDDEIRIPCNDINRKTVNDPYNDDDDGTHSSNPKSNDDLTHKCERVKERDCFTCIVM